MAYTALSPHATVCCSLQSCLRTRRSAAFCRYKSAQAYKCASSEVTAAHKLREFGSESTEYTFSTLHFPLCDHLSKALAVTSEQRPQTIFPSCSKWKHSSTIVRWITHELILWTLLSVDTLVSTKHKKCVFQFSQNWAFLCPIKPILREGKLLWSHLIRTNDRCCKQAEWFNSDLRYWFDSVHNYFVDWGYASSQSAATGAFVFWCPLYRFVANSSWTCWTIEILLLNIPDGKIHVEIIRFSISLVIPHIARQNWNVLMSGGYCLKRKLQSTTLNSVGVTQHEESITKYVNIQYIL